MWARCPREAWAGSDFLFLLSQARRADSRGRPGLLCVSCGIFRGPRSLNISWSDAVPRLPGQASGLRGREGGRRAACPDQPLVRRFEQAFVSSLIYNWDGEYFWTALQDLNGTGSFRWLSGDEVMYTHWNRDQPGEPLP